VGVDVIAQASQAGGKNGNATGMAGR
jgi:hypothetical protein